MRAFRRLLLKLVGIGAALGAAGIAVAAVAGRQVLSLLYRPEYGDAAGTFTWMMVAGALAYVGTFLNTGMVAARRIGAQTPLFVAVAAAGFAACAVLVPRYGLTGAAWAVLLSQAVQVAGAGWILASAMKAPGTSEASQSER